MAPTEDEATARVDRFLDALFALDAAVLRDGVRGLPKAAGAPLHKAASTPFPALGRMSDPKPALRRVKDLVLLGAVADSCAQACLEVTLDLLGDAADDPTIEQLRSIIPPISEQFPAPIVRLMFASVAISRAPAADKCDEILVVDLPAVETADEAADAEAASTSPDTETAPGPTAHQASDEVRAARRARRHAQQEERRKQQEARARGEQALREAKRARPTTTTNDATDAVTSPVVTHVTRRDAQLTPEQAKDFDTDDELAGSVVIALVPFDAAPPAEPGPQQKRRPCIVIGTSSSHLLVRPCYSEGGSQSRRWQSHPLRDWVAAGLDRATYVEDEVRAIARLDAGEVLGRITAEDWNALW